MEDIKAKVEEFSIDENDPVVDVDALRRVHKQVLEERAKTNQEIISLAVRHNKRQFADDAIGINISLEEFRGQLLNTIDTKPLDAGAEPVQKPVNENRNYSFLRALNAVRRGDWSGAGFEAGMSQEVSHKRGRSNEPTGITQTSGIGSVAIGTNGGAPTWASVVQLVKEVEINNVAINGNTLGYLTNPKVK